MDNIITGIKMAFGVISGAVAQLLGGWDAWLSTLIVLMVLDFITGILKAVLLKSEKTNKGGIDSRIMFRGGIKKLMIFVIIALASVADKIIMPDGECIRSITAGYYIASEGLSIIENAGACGLPLPKKLVSVLEQLKEKNA